MKMSLSKTKVLSVLIIGLFIGVSMVSSIAPIDDESTFNSNEELNNKNEEGFLFVTLESSPVELIETKHGIDGTMVDFGSILIPGEPTSFY